MGKAKETELMAKLPDGQVLNSIFEKDYFAYVEPEYEWSYSQNSSPTKGALRHIRVRIALF